MTREEAIEVLEVHKAHWERLLDNGICDVLEGGNTIQALKVAIRALKNEQSKMSNRKSDSSNLISQSDSSNLRSQMIEDLKTLIAYFEEESNGCCPMCLQYCLDMLNDMEKGETKNDND